MAAESQMLCFDAMGGQFHIRVGAIIFRQGHLLIHRGVNDPHWSVPGGRVEWHETSAGALSREISEETGTAIHIVGLRFVLENFFVHSDVRCHQVGLFFEATFIGDFPFVVDDICHRAQDGDSDLIFRWVWADELTLNSCSFVPATLVGHLLRPLAGITHLVEGWHPVAARGVRN